MKKWISVVRLMNEGEVDMPLRFSYDKFRSLRAVCLRESKSEKSDYIYEPHFFNGNVMIIKTRKS